MQLAPIDWWIIALTLAVTVGLGLLMSRRAGSGEQEYFLSGRDAPWWLLGLSMVATSFSADTPNLVTDIVRKHGVGGNWVWWAFLITGMTTVFLYARLWRRSGVFTDVEFYELRYSGPAAAVLRGFRALYLGILFNVVVMATVCLAAIKIGAALLGTTPMETIVLASIVSVVVAGAGGLRAVLLSDAFLFLLSMTGAVAAAVFALGAPGVGGLDGLLNAAETSDKLALVPLPERGATGEWTPESLDLFVSALVLPLAVQWWSLWYPGAEPGGGGYVAQRMLAARDERQARSAAQNPFFGETILPGCERGCFARKIDKKGFWTKRALPKWCPLKNHTPKIRNSARQTRFLSAFTETAPAIGFHERNRQNVSRIEVAA